MSLEDLSQKFSTIKLNNSNPISMPTDSVSREEFLELQKQLTSLVSKQAKPVVKNETKVWIEKDPPPLPIFPD